MLSEADRAYVAALVDNFGRLTSRTLPNQTELPEVSIQGRVDALDWVAAVTGTKVVEIPKAYNATRCSQHCTDKHVHVITTARRWVLTGARATIVLHTVEPFMRVQGRQARDLVELGRRVGYKRPVVEEMRALGWSIPELRENGWLPVAREEVSA